MSSPSSGLVFDFARKAPESFARSIETHSDQEISAIMEKLPENLATAILMHLPATTAENLLNELSAKRSAWIIEGSLESAKAVLIRLPALRRRAIVAELSGGKRRTALQRFLTYPNHSLGKFVSSEVLMINESLPTSDAIKLIKSNPAGIPVVIVDKANHYVGFLNERKVLEGDTSVAVRKYTDTVAPLLAETSLADTEAAKQWQQVSLLAVIDHERNVLGVMSRERLLQCMGSAPEVQKPLDSLLTVFGMYVTVLIKLLESLFRVSNRS